MKYCMSLKINQCCKQTLREWNHFNSCCIKKSLRVQLPGLQFDQNLGKSDRRDRFVQTFRSGQHQDSLDRSESCYHRSLEPSVKQMTHRFSFKSNKLTPRKWLRGHSIISIDQIITTNMNWSKWLLNQFIKMIV